MVTRSRMKRSGAGGKKTSRLKRQKSNYIEKFKGDTITSGKYHSWSVTEDGKNDVSLGNLSDAGWYWDGGDGDMVGYLIRIKDSQIRDDFVNDVKGKVSFNDVKPRLLKDLQKNDGLYQVSGDNANWRFGSGWEIDSDSEKDNLKDMNPDLTDAQAEKIVDDAFSYQEVRYEDFEKQFGDIYNKEMKDIINKSNTFEEFFDEVDSEDFKQNWMERTYIEYFEGTYREALGKALNVFRNKKK